MDPSSRLTPVWESSFVVVVVVVGLSLATDLGFLSWSKLLLSL